VGRSWFVKALGLWHIKSGFPGMTATKGRSQPAMLEGPPLDVARNRSLSQFCRLERVAGYGIIGARRKNSSHFRRPRRATYARVRHGAREGPFLRCRSTAKSPSRRPDQLAQTCIID
jgi:hypothetical protein